MINFIKKALLGALVFGVMAPVLAAGAGAERSVYMVEKPVENKNLALAPKGCVLDIAGVETEGEFIKESLRLMQSIKGTNLTLRQKVSCKFDLSHFYEDLADHMESLTFLCFDAEKVGINFETMAKNIEEGPVLTKLEVLFFRVPADKALEFGEDLANIIRQAARKFPKLKKIMINGVEVYLPRGYFETLL